MNYTCIYFVLQMLMNVRATLARTEGLVLTRLTSITAPVYLDTFMFVNTYSIEL